MESQALSVKPSFIQKIKQFFQPMDLTQGKISKVLTVFSLPIMLSYLLQQVYTLSDAAICGQTLSADEVAGVNDTFALVFIFLQFAFGCTAGFSVVTSGKIGQNDLAGTRKSFATQIVLCGTITVVLTVISCLALPTMLGWMHVTPQNPHVYQAAYTYCLIIFLGIFAQMFYNFICCILRSIGDAFTPLAFLLFSTILNVGLDLLFLVVFRWGVAGAAGATVLAQFLSTVACFWYTFAKYPYLRLKKEDFRLNGRDIFSHVSLGIPLGLQYSVLAIGIIVMQAQVVRFDILPDGFMVEGNPAQNGFGAANKLINFMMAPLIGLGTAMVSFCAQNLGAGNYTRIKEGIKSGMLMMLALYVVFGGLGLLTSLGGGYQYLFLSPDKITPESIRYGNHYLYVDFPLFFLLGSLSVLRSVAQGIGKPLFTLLGGAGELIARVVIGLFLPPLMNGGPINALGSSWSYVALCLADPGAWLVASLVVGIPIYYIIWKQRWQYLC